MRENFLGQLYLLTVQKTQKKQKTNTDQMQVYIL